MSIQLYSNIINKLKTLDNGIVTLFKLGTPNAINKEKEIRNILDNKIAYLDDIGLKAVSAFLQYSTITNLFTYEEWDILINRIDYGALYNSSVTERVRHPEKCNFNKPMYATQNRLYNNNTNVLKAENDYLKLLSINKNVSIEFFIKYIVNQL